MRKIKFWCLSLIVLISFAFQACTSTTIIKTNPAGAKVYLNGEYAGETPCKYSDQKIVGSITYVKITKPGYKEFTTSFQRDEKFNVGACIGGVIILFPFLWIMDYKPERTYELERGS